MAECGHGVVCLIYDSKAECKWKWQCKRCGAPFVPYNFGDEQKHPDFARLDALLKLGMVRKYEPVGLVGHYRVLRTRAEIDEMLGKEDDDAK